MNYNLNPTGGYGSLTRYGSALPGLNGPAPVSLPAPMAPTISPGSPVAAPSVSETGAPGGFWGFMNKSWEDRNGLGKTLWAEEGGLNLSNIGSLAQTIGAFGQLWSGIQANRLARESFKVQKENYKTNLANQISTFNMSLEDRAFARAAQKGQSREEAQAYIDKHKL